MTNPLKRLLGAGTSSADIAAALEKTRADLTAAEKAVEAAEKQYEDSLLDLDKPGLRKLLDTATEAKIDRDQQQAKIARLSTELQKATAAEAEAGRRERYARAREMSEAAQKKLLRDYPKAAEAVRALLGDIAAADLAVSAANADLPEGAGRLAGPEEFRSTANLYKEILDETVVDLWCDSAGTPIANDLQGRVLPEARPRRGDDTVYGQVETEHGKLEVHKRRLLRRRFLPQQSGRVIASLASDLSLPPLYAGADAYWSASNFSPARIVEELNKPLRGRPEDPERKPEVEHANPPREIAE